MCFRRTDLPVPEGPRMAVILLFGTSKLTSSSTVWVPKDLVTPRREMIGPPGLDAGAGLLRLHTGRTPVGLPPCGPA